MTPPVGGNVKPLGTTATDDHKITQAAFRKVKCEEIRKRKDEPDNILLACFRCNNIRGNTSYEVFYAFAQYIIRQYPYAPTPLLRLGLAQFKDSLADLAIRNHAGTRRALSAALLSIGEQLR
jgi:hypothetical protein